MSGELYPSCGRVAAIAIFLPELPGTLPRSAHRHACLHGCNAGVDKWNGCRDDMPDARARPFSQGLILIDLLSQVLLALAIGLATSLALASAVLLIAA